MPIVGPVIQTGIHLRSASAPVTATGHGGPRVRRTAEERKAHRMAKNRATAAASRYDACHDRLTHPGTHVMQGHRYLVGSLPGSDE